jgi:hypothetical protein
MFIDSILYLCSFILTAVGLVSLIAGITAGTISYLIWKSSPVGADELDRISRADDLVGYCVNALLFCGIAWTILAVIEGLLS